MKQLIHSLAATALLGLTVALNTASAGTEHSEVSMKRTLPVTAEALWEQVGGFFALADWHPAIASSGAEAGGRHRRIVLGDGTEFLEVLISYDVNHYRYRYRILDPTPLPFKNYTGTLHIDPEGEQSTIVWSARYEPVGEPEEVRRMLKGLFEAGFENLARQYGGQ